jgi:hypothetical protein
MRPIQLDPSVGLFGASVLIVAGLLWSSQLALAQFTQPAPTVTAIAPASGSTLGGAPIIITGTNLQPPTGATTVTIGGTAATDIWVIDATTVQAVAPPGTAGAADVVVTTPRGTGTGSALYTYLTPPFLQQGSKLVGTLAVGSSEQGQSVALSADGNTAIVGGDNDNAEIGAAWVYTRNGAVWSQQGSKLVGTGVVGEVAYQGTSVALSADGNTAIVGGPSDDFLIGHGSVGAAWVFTRSGGVWTQQGKLVGTGAVTFNGVEQGISVALSGDGNTAIVGGPFDNLFAGAAWVFTRSGGVWTQQGSKLVGTGAVGSAEQGFSVALSGDGNTALLGGPFNNSGAGAVWVYTRSSGVWSQQGSKLVGTGGTAGNDYASSVALSGDGNTAIVGAPFDSGGPLDADAGAAWVFTRSGGVWTQQGSKLVGTGGVPFVDAEQGFSVALSGDGNTALVGGPFNNFLAGAAWVFTRSGGAWTQKGSLLVGAGASGTQSFQGQSVALSADGNTAILGAFGDNSYIGAAWVFVRPGLQVGPPASMATAGNPGGPFTPSSFQYQVSATVGSINYSISGIPNWLTPPSTTGSVSSGTPMTFTVNGNANSLAAGTYSAAISFTNTDTGQGTQTRSASLIVNPFEIAPAGGILASGQQGGPFAPSFSYTLTAPSESVKFSITSVPSWLTASSTSGTVTKTGKTITFRVNSSADKLSPGSYIGSIGFNNTINSQGNTTRLATLTVTPKEYTIKVSASPTTDGTVSGGGAFLGGTSQTVMATPNAGHAFVRWTESGKVVSTSQSYMFMLSANVTLVADFK